MSDEQAEPELRPSFEECAAGKHARCPGKVDAVVSRHEPRERFLDPLRCSCACHATEPLPRRVGPW